MRSAFHCQRVAYLEHGGELILPLIPVILIAAAPRCRTSNGDGPLSADYRAFAKNLESLQASPSVTPCSYTGLLFSILRDNASCASVSLTIKRLLLTAQLAHAHSTPV